MRRSWTRSGTGTGPADWQEGPSAAPGRRDGWRRWRRRWRWWSWWWWWAGRRGRGGRLRGGRGGAGPGRVVARVSVEPGATVVPGTLTLWTARCSGGSAGGRGITAPRQPRERDRSHDDGHRRDGHQVPRTPPATEGRCTGGSHTVQQLIQQILAELDLDELDTAAHLDDVAGPVGLTQLGHLVDRPPDRSIGTRPAPRSPATQHPRGAPPARHAPPIPTRQPTRQRPSSINKPVTRSTPPPWSRPRHDSHTIGTVRTTSPTRPRRSDPNPTCLVGFRPVRCSPCRTRPQLQSSSRSPTR